MANSDFDRVARILALVGLNSTSNEQKYQPHTLLKEILKTNSPALLASASSAEISQWLTVSKTLTDSPQETSKILESLDKYLKTKSFLVGFSFSIADVAVLEPLLSQSLVSYPEVNRWSTLIRSRCHCQSSPSQQPLILPTVFPTLLRKPIQGGNEPATTGAASADSAANKTVVATNSSSSTTQTKEKSGGEEETKDDKKKDSSKQKVKEKSKDNKEKEKKSGPESDNSTSSGTGAGTGAVDADLDPSKLEFRVGLVVKCWDHPEAEKLLCEEIDLGESNGPRQIASGLRAHYHASEVQGRKVIVLANLKDRNMVGFKSQGMVICASNADHTVVKLLEPPPGANIGDRVVFDGFAGEPASASALAKKKILEKLLPEMKTNEEGIPMCLSRPFKIGDQVCRSPIPNGTVG